ncbi:MAG TPA: SRPBCC domain-containing protein [Caulobacteraceae bacterium]|nr:SRPBCC domain-containing protein [Caulobacteraceae bacterium]
MTDLGETYRVPAVRFERLIAAPAETVWAHLTDCGKLAAWYGEDGSIEPREGGAVHMAGGHIRGVVTQYKPNRRLAYTWNVFAPGEQESPYPESYLTIELQARGNETLLVLTHLPVLDRFEPQNAMGWHTFLDMLDATIAGRPVLGRGEYMEKNAALYEVDLANLQR